MVALKVEPSMVLCKRSPPPRVISSSGLCSELCEECQRGNEGREGDFFALADKEIGDKSIKCGVF